MRRKNRLLSALLCMILCTAQLSLYTYAAEPKSALDDSAAASEEPSAQGGRLMAYYYGDADLNGQVEASDALRILRHAVKLGGLDEQNALVMSLADITLDGQVTAEDALYVLRTVVKLEPEEIYTMDVLGTEPPETEPPETEEPAVSPKPTRRPRESAEPTKWPEGGTMDVKDRSAWKLWGSYEEMPYYDAAIDQEIPRLVPYIASDNPTGACVIVCPGGGYASENTSVSGAADIAGALCDEGITAFALSYRTAPYTYQAMLSDILRAVRFVRYYHESLGIDPGNVTVMGFSAGGHLALMSMEHYADEDIEPAGDAVDAWPARPDAGVLGYAVVSMMDDYGHQTSRENFLGPENADNEELKRKYSGELGVTDDTPPMFIWHCMPDRAVSYKSSELLAETLKAHDIDYELHIYETGTHGVGLARDYREVSQWFADCVEWIRAWD